MKNIFTRFAFKTYLLVGFVITFSIGITMGQAPPDSITIETMPAYCGGNDGSITSHYWVGGVDQTAYITWLWNTGETTQGINSIGNMVLRSVEISLHYSTPPYEVIETYQTDLYFIGSATETITADITTTDDYCGGDNGSIVINNVLGVNHYNSAWSNGATQIVIPWNQASGINNLPAGNYSVTINDVAHTACSVVYYQTVDEFILSGSITSTDETCGSANGSASVTGLNGSGYYSYSWNNGATTSEINGLSAGVYSVLVTDIAYPNCTLNLSVTIANSGSGLNPGMSGIISTSGGVVTAGNVYMIQTNLNNGQWDTLSVAAIQNDGSYVINNVPVNDEIILFAVPDHSLYPLTIPTYFGNVYNWQSTSHTIPDCGQALVNDVTVIELNPLTGNCDFTGGVFFATGKMESNTPIPNIDIMITKTPPGNVYSYTQSDNNGLYTFTDVEVGQTYHFYVNIPGLPMMENYNIVVSSGDLLYQDLNFYIDTMTGPDAGIYIQDIVTSVSEQTDKIVVYPNPTTGTITFKGLNEKATATIMDATGRMILAAEVINNKVDVSVLANGVYVMRVETGNGVSNFRIVKQ